MLGALAPRNSLGSEDYGSLQGCVVGERVYARTNSGYFKQTFRVVEKVY